MKFKSPYVEPGLQFQFILFLLFLVTLEGLFLGWAFSRAILIAGNWQQPDQVTRFFMVVFFTIVPVVVVNIVIGLYWSLRFVRPLKQLEEGLESVRRGDLNVHIQLHPGDTLRELIKKFNDLVITLKSLMSQDRGFVLEAVEKLENCKKELETMPENEKIDKIRKIIVSTQSKLTIVSAHFTKEKARNGN